MANTIKFGNGQWATKEDSILAYNDENANFKPLPFVTSRATTATRVNKAGLLETVASGVPRVDYLDNSKGSYLLEPSSTNLITQSEAFGNSYWTKSGASIQGDASTAGSEEVVNGDFATDTNWTKGTGWSIGSGVANCDGSANNAITQSIPFEDGKTYKITFDVTARTQGSVRLFVNLPVFTELIDTSDIGTHTVTVSVKGGSQTLYLYSTNNFIGSIDNVSVKEIQGFASPSVDSHLGAFKLVENSGTGQHRMSATISSPSAIHTISAFFKPIGTNRKAYLDMGSVTGFFDFTTKVFTSATGVGSYEEVSDGWYKLSLTSNSAITISAIYIGLAISNETYTGDGTSGVYIFASQLEAQSYATSYIPTKGSQISRLAESASKSGISSLINSSEGVFYAEISALNEDQPVKAISISNQSLSNRVLIVLVGGELRGQFVSGTDNISKTTSGVVIENFNKIACSYTSTTFKVFVNGLQIGNTSAISTALVGLTGLSFDRGDGGLKFVGKTKQLQVYKTALTDSELQTLTTI